MKSRAFPAALLLLAACSPSLDTCRKVMPVVSEPVALVATPGGQTGCTCTVDGVKVTVLPVRDGLFGWKRGQIWIEDAPVEEADFTTKLDDAKLRKRAELAAEQSRDAVQRAVDKANAVAKGLRDAFRK